MRRSASFGLLLLLSGCGFDTWWNPPLTGGFNPHAPATESENMLRVTGQQPDVPALAQEPGNIWPGPLPPEPTLQDLQQQTGPLGSQAPAPPPQLSRGSSTPPGSNQPGLAPLPNRPPASPPTARAAPPPERSQAGRVVNTPSGAGVTTGGTQGYQTMALPGGGSAIVVPNGNGTSTVIKPDGTMETVPTPR